MVFKQTINEVQAEIVNGSIPLNKIFNDNGDIVKLKKGDDWATLLSEIIAAIKKAGLIDDFKQDMDPVDISGSIASGRVNIISDSGKKYYYNINKKKLFRA